MPLLEKAFAKLDQNYDRIIGGNGREGLRTLTGMPTLYTSITKDNRVEQKAVYTNWAKNNYPMVLSCCNPGERNGLVTGHAYSLLDIRDVTINGKKTSLAKVRNPWASERYNGPWRDDDPNWTPALRKELNAVKSNDGAFWMPFDNFLNFFRRIGVALYRPYKYKQIPLNFKERSKTITVENPTD